jgi:sodium/bile acid cotransporter 7
VSNVLGVALTPLLMALMVQGHGAAGAEVSLSWHSVQAIVLQLLLPFAVGHLLQPHLGGWVQRQRSLLKVFDQGTILLVVYAAFSEAVVMGLYRQIDGGVLLLVLAACAVLLAAVMGLLIWGSARLGFSAADRVAIVFCGSKKTLASGVPMAQVLFAGQSVGLLVLPLMLFHQLQLMVCAALAQRYARQA